MEEGRQMTTAVKPHLEPSQNAQTVPLPCSVLGEINFPNGVIGLVDDVLPNIRSLYREASCSRKDWNRLIRVTVLPN